MTSIPADAPPAFHLLAKPTGAICNLDCDVRFACHGECPKNRFCEAPQSPQGGVGIETPDGEPGLNYLCAGFKHFFHHADFPMKLMAGLIRPGREAKEVMPVLEQAFTDVSRNDPCPCGSGRKFKQCHGRDPSPSPAQHQAVARSTVTDGGGVWIAPAANVANLPMHQTPCNRSVNLRRNYYA